MLCGTGILAGVMIWGFEGPWTFTMQRVAGAVLSCAAGIGACLRGYQTLLTAKRYSSGMAALPLVIICGPFVLTLAALLAASLLSNEETSPGIRPLLEKLLFVAVFFLPTPLALRSLLWAWALPDKSRHGRRLKWSLTHYPTPRLPPAGQVR